MDMRTRLTEANAEESQSEIANEINRHYLTIGGPAPRIRVLESRPTQLKRAAYMLTHDEHHENKAKG